MVETTSLNRFSNSMCSEYGKYSTTNDLFVHLFENKYDCMKCFNKTSGYHLLRKVWMGWSWKCSWLPRFSSPEWLSSKLLVHAWNFCFTMHHNRSAFLLYVTQPNAKLPPVFKILRFKKKNCYGSWQVLIPSSLG